MSAADFPPGGAESRATLSRLLRILLIVSLALNMFFLGAGAVFLGRILFAPEKTVQVRHRGDFFPGPAMMLRALPPETRERVEQAIADDRAAMKEAWETSRRARREAFQALVAEPFSAESYRQRLAAAQAADLAAVSAAHKMVAAATAQLTPDERRTLVERIRARRFKKHLEDRGPPPPGEPDGPPPL